MSPTAEPRTYQGRPLPRPDEEIVDQGLPFDVGTLHSRRRVFPLLGVGLAGAAGLALTGCAGATRGSTKEPSADASGSAPDSSGSTEIPDETAGPYPGDGSNGPDVLSESGIVRSDLRASFGTGHATAEGLSMTLTLTILDLASGGGPFAGVAVYVWHCNRDGQYSMYASGLEIENYLRGVQIADADGTVTFTSIFPACYSGRWPHIHFEVYPERADITDSDEASSTSQVALPKSVCDTVYATPGYEQSAKNLSQVGLDTDNVFGDDAGEHQLATVTGSTSTGYSVRLTVPVDTRTEPTGGSMPGSGPNGGGPGAPPSVMPSGAPPSGMPSRTS